MIILASLAILLAGATGWRLYKDYNPQSYINFAQYTPTNIVDNLQVNDKVLEVWSSNIFTSLKPYAVSAILHLNRQDSYITETKYTDNSADSTCDGDNVVCADKTSPQGQAYKLALVYDVADVAKRQLHTEEVIFNKVARASKLMSKVRVRQLPKRRGAICSIRLSLRRSTGCA